MSEQIKAKRKQKGYLLFSKEVRSVFRNTKTQVFHDGEKIGEDKVESSEWISQKYEFVCVIVAMINLSKLMNLKMGGNTMSNSNAFSNGNNRNNDFD